MKKAWTIREERESDFKSISTVTREAFKNLEISDQTEHLIINALRHAGALTISLVAEIDGRIVGHIAFSPVTISDGTEHWYGLGPVSVLPDYQNQGIGKNLIHQGLSMLREIGAEGCVLVGHPEYYPQFGFRNIPELIYEGVPQEAFLILPFTDKTPEGQVVFHDAFNMKE